MCSKALHAILVTDGYTAMYTIHRPISKFRGWSYVRHENKNYLLCGNIETGYFIDLTHRTEPGREHTIFHGINHIRIAA